VNERERFLRGFHAERPGVTALGLARGGSYDRLAALVPANARVLDLACGDGALLARLGARAIGIDLSHDELARCTGRVAQARAQELPLAAGAFDVCTCHLAFMLLDDPERVVAELERVLVPGGELLAVLGGGPVAGDREPDAFHAFLSILARHPRAVPRLGDPRARTEAGWRALFAGWDVAPFERWELDLGGTFDDVWAFLGASYELVRTDADAVRAELHAAIGDRATCRVAMFLARATTRSTDRTGAI
jgi:SAM-dependent methyltransferase